MRVLKILPALLLAAWSFALVPVADAVEPMPDCVRNGPPCGAGCVVGHETDCAVTFYWVVCVTEPCDPMMLCLAWGTVCTA